MQPRSRIEWVQTNLEFELEVQHPNQTTETKPYIIDTFCPHHAAVEPTLYPSPGGKWVRRVSVAELAGPSRNEPSVPGTGKHLTRKEVVDRDD
jgi:hypothetical protein